MLWVLIRIAEAMILICTHNIGFYEDLTKIIIQLSSNFIKFTPYLSSESKQIGDSLKWKNLSVAVFDPHFSTD